VAGEVLEAWLVGSGLGELEDPGAPYRTVTVQQLQDVAAAYLGKLTRAEGIVRGSGGSR
jgi:hypothetical protein